MKPVEGVDETCERMKPAEGIDETFDEELIKPMMRS